LRAIQEGNSCLLSTGAPDSPVHHRTLFGAPPDTVRCGFLSYSGATDRWRLGAVGAPDTVLCTPDSPVLPSDRWLGHASRADCAATVGAPDHWLTGQSGASPDSPVNYSRTLLTWFPRAATSPQPTHRTLSGAPPDSPMNFSHTPPTNSRERPFHQSQPGAPDTVRCTTGQSGAPRLSRVLAARAKTYLIVFSLILALRQIC
jgi:hypothetical protein